ALEELIQRRCLRLAWRWAADWRERSDDLSDATFVNLAFLSDRRGTGTAAWHRTGEIFAEGFGRFPDASYTPALRAGHALHLAVDGELDRARELLADFDPSQAAVAHLDFAFGAEAVVAADDGDAELAVTKLRTITHHVSLAKERTKDRLLLRLENVLLAK